MNKRYQKLVERGQKYAAAPGAGYGDEQAQVIGEELEAMEKACLPVTPGNLVAKATPEDAPLHPFFTWDDPKAAHSYRKWEARQMVSHLVIITEGPQQAEIAKSHFSVIVTEAVEEEEADSDHQYVSRRRILTEAELKAQVVEQGWRELMAFARKYEPLGVRDFTAVFALVGKHQK